MAHSLEADINQYYCPPSNPDKAQIWQVDYEYLGANCNLYPNNYDPIGTQAEEKEEKVAIIVQTYEELLYGLADPSYIISEIRPQNPEDLKRIEEFLAIEDGDSIVLEFSSDGAITSFNGLDRLNLQNAVVPVVSDFGCLYDNEKRENELSSQPYPIQYYINNNAYTLISTNYIQAELYYDNVKKRFVNKALNVFIPVKPDNIDAIVEKAPTMSSEKANNHGLIITSQIAAHLNPNDGQNNPINMQLMCSYLRTPNGVIYDELMKNGAQFLIANRSLGINTRLDLSTLNIINNEFKPYTAEDRIPPIVINALGNEARENDLTYTDPFSSFLLGGGSYDVSPFDTNDSSKEYKLSRYSNYPMISDYSMVANAIAYGSFNGVEGGNQEYFSQSGTSMSAPHILIAFVNGMMSLTEEERNALKGLKPYEVFNIGLEKYGSKQFMYSNVYGDVKASVVVSGQIVFNSMPDKKFYNGWTIAPTATISIDDYISNYNAGNFGMIDWTSTTPITYPNQIITRSIAEITTQDYATISASLVITSPFGQILNAKFNLKPEKQPIDFELAFIKLPISLTNMAIRNQPLITIPRNQIQYIPFSNAKHRNYLPLIKKP
jgi:hypothetical protein